MWPATFRTLSSDKVWAPYCQAGQGSLVGMPRRPRSSVSQSLSNQAHLVPEDPLAESHQNRAVWECEKCAALGTRRPALEARLCHFHFHLFVFSLYSYIYSRLASSSQRSWGLRIQADWIERGKRHVIERRKEMHAARGLIQLQELPTDCCSGLPGSLGEKGNRMACVTT